METELNSILQQQTRRIDELQKQLLENTEQQKTSKEEGTQTITDSELNFTSGVTKEIISSTKEIHFLKRELFDLKENEIKIKQELLKYKQDYDCIKNEEIKMDRVMDGMKSTIESISSENKKYIQKLEKLKHKLFKLEKILRKEARMKSINKDKILNRMMTLKMKLQRSTQQEEKHQFVSELIEEHIPSDIGLEPFNSNEEKGNSEKPKEPASEAAEKRNDQVLQNEIADVSTWFQGGSDWFQGGSDWFQGGSDWFQGGTDWFQGGSDRFHGGFDWYQGDTNWFQCGSDRFQDGSDWLQGGSDWFQGGFDWCQGTPRRRDVFAKIRGKTLQINNEKYTIEQLQSMNYTENPEDLNKSTSQKEITKADSEPATPTTISQLTFFEDSIRHFELKTPKENTKSEVVLEQNGECSTINLNENVSQISEVRSKISDEQTTCSGSASGPSEIPLSSIPTLGSLRGPEAPHPYHVTIPGSNRGPGNTSNLRDAKADTQVGSAPGTSRVPVPDEMSSPGPSNFGSRGATKMAPGSKAERALEGDISSENPTLSEEERLLSDNVAQVGTRLGEMKVKRANRSGAAKQRAARRRTEATASNPNTQPEPEGNRQPQTSSKAQTEKSQVPRNPKKPAYAGKRSAKGNAGSQVPKGAA
ncbi:unnamed protein product [Phaedon cochleariae]|uniref:Uncharacterized protein n=1 Tax=Phaedon cochleariae TaxID=80249 RepID=A0A9N9X131_PHACE|nr:unnamed protein product [Phaedon cochleariae]